MVWSPDDEFMNPWDKATPPAWPGGVFPDAIEQALRETADRDQLDLGAFGGAYMAAASGAAHKGARLTPYAGSVWQVPPILWTLLIGDSGQRKTALFDYVTRQIKQVHRDHIKAHRAAFALWKARSAAQKNKPPPPEEKGFLASDVSLEKLQEWIANNPRGLFYARDELAPWFEFGRYTKRGLGKRGRCGRSTWKRARWGHRLGRTYGTPDHADGELRAGHPGVHPGGPAGRFHRAGQGRADPAVRHRADPGR